jgi:hypothetical protein
MINIPEHYDQSIIIIVVVLIIFLFYITDY